MNTVIDTHCETALESPYSRDREEAIEELGRVYPDADRRNKEQILETLREVSHDSSSRSDRDLARDTLVDCFETDPSTAESIVVDAFCTLAEDSKLSDERLDAIDTLRRFYPDVSEQYREVIGKTLAAIAGDATYEDERERARRRLSDIARDERRSSSDDDPAEEVGYLGITLAEHLEKAAHEGSEECLQRAEEVSEFLSEHPVSDDAYEDVKENVESLVTQLEVVPTGKQLDDDRIDRVERISSRVERLYTRQ